MKFGRLSQAMNKAFTHGRAVGVIGAFAIAASTVASAQAAGTAIDTSTSWNGTDQIATWGVPGTATFGQTITGISGQELEDFTIYMRKTSGDAVQYQAFVYEWDTANSRIVGAPLYASTVLTATGNGTFTPVTFATGGLSLSDTKKYVLFLTTSTVSGQNTGAYVWGRVPNATYSGGQVVVMNNGENFAALSNSLWLAMNTDLAFSANFAPSYVPPQILAAVLAQGNSAAIGAAKVLDANANLRHLFDGATGNNKAISNGVTQTLPLLTGGTTTAMQGVMASINQVIQSRLNARRGMASGADAVGDRDVWIKPFGAWAEQGNRDGVDGFKANSYGVVVGFDAPVNSSVRVGAAVAYAKTDVTGQSSVAPQSADIATYQVVAYGNLKLDHNINVDVQADVGQNTTDGRRQIALTSSTATSSFKSDTAHVGVSVGRDFPISAQTTLTPMVRADYTYIKDKGYAETGAGLLNLSVKERSVEAMIVGVDAKLTHKLNDQITVVGNAGVGYDAIAKQNMVSAAYEGGGATFVTYGIDPSPWLARGGLGVVYKTKAGVELSARYDAEYRETFLNQSATAKARWAF